MIDITKKYKTKNGHDVVLISDKGRGEYPIVGFVGYDEDVQTWRNNGVFHLGNNFNHLDLVEVKEKKVMYVNVYEDGSICGYESQNGAWEDRQQKNGRISCIRVEYEEGQFDE